MLLASSLALAVAAVLGCILVHFRQVYSIIGLLRGGDPRGRGFPNIP